MAKTILMKESETNLLMLGESRQIMQENLLAGAVGQRPTTGRQRRVVPSWTNRKTTWKSTPGGSGSAESSRPGTSVSALFGGASSLRPSTTSASLGSSLPTLGFGQRQNSWGSLSYGGAGSARLSSSSWLFSRTPSTPSSYAAQPTSRLVEQSQVCTFQAGFIQYNTVLQVHSITLFFSENRSLNVSLIGS